MYGTPTPYFAPTFTSHQAEVYSLLLETNAGCDDRLPCFWGIVFAESNLSDLEELAAKLGKSIGVYDRNEEQFASFGSSSLSNVDVRAYFLVEDEIIKNGQIDVNLIDGATSTRISNTHWKAFTPDAILRMYGMPHRVEFSVDFAHEPTTNPDRALYHMQMFFPNSNFISFYGYGFDESGKDVEICPLSDGEGGFSYIRLYLGAGLPNEPNPMIPLEDATSLSIAEFYELLTENPDSACFDVDLAAFGFE